MEGVKPCNHIVFEVYVPMLVRLADLRSNDQHFRFEVIPTNLPSSSGRTPQNREMVRNGRIDGV